MTTATLRRMVRAMIRGEEEITMRAIGEIGHKTGFNMNMQLSARSDDQS